MELGAVASLCVLIVFLIGMVKIVGIRQDVGEIKRLLKKQIGEEDEEKPKASPEPIIIKNKETTKIENLIVFIVFVLLFFAIGFFAIRNQR
jgi:uncharacterized integral membrane protein